MPREKEAVWLDPPRSDYGALRDLLVPYPADEMEAYQISRLVNSPQNDTAEVMARGTLL